MKLSAQSGMSALKIGRSEGAAFGRLQLRQDAPLLSRGNQDWNVT